MFISCPIRQPNQCTSIILTTPLNPNMQLCQCPSVPAHSPVVPAVGLPAALPKYLSSSLLPSLLILSGSSWMHWGLGCDRDITGLNADPGGENLGQAVPTHLQIPPTSFCERRGEALKKSQPTPEICRCRHSHLPHFLKAQHLCGSGSHVKQQP